MPRSYRFDHFLVAPTEPRSRSLALEDKRHVAESRRPLRGAEEEGVHYGKSHAETEEILRARFLAHPRQAPAAQARESRAAPRINRNTTPIGALPATEELPPRGRFQDLIDEAARQLEVLQGGIGDVGKAAVRLASLPVEVLRLAARRLRLVHG